MEPERRKPPFRKWWLLIAGIVVYLAVFSLLESLVRTDRATSDTDSTSADAADAARSPAPPHVRRLEDGGIEIRHDFFRRSTIRLGNEEDEKALYDCLEREVEQTFGDGTEGWDRERVRRETQRIQNECLGLPGLPGPPGLPRPGGDGS
jgi:hypothetical protein